MTLDELWGNTPAMREPSAEARQWAVELHERYVALILEGFHPEPALTIVCHIARGDRE